MKMTGIRKKRKMQKDLYDKVVNMIGDDCLDDKNSSVISQVLSPRNARAIARSGINVVVSVDYSITSMDWSKRESRLTYITSKGTLEEVYNEFGMCISKKFFDNEGVRLRKKKSHKGVCGEEEIHDDDEVRIAQAG